MSLCPSQACAVGHAHELLCAFVSSGTSDALSGPVCIASKYNCIICGSLVFAVGGTSPVLC